ncbi:thioredoxin family protein [Saccharibacillus brassicae]|uniref:Thioredoxin family protein n=1 Tax=Saccharibacillus brassicae TaxID=2583377 RepID=A0A4Y6V168_SACBS|nr:thioredoxin family protein [Saccharibacillus brassicae]QDH22351.1 thioredoxin family protein [Saccharibacillus brassicae]
MKKGHDLHTARAMDEFVGQPGLRFLYVSAPDCSTCRALLPKLQELLGDYPAIEFAHVDAAEVEEVAERFLILAAPILLLLIDGREYLREDRFVRFGPLRERLDRIHELYAG